jgi:hypothetical protein
MQFYLPPIDVKNIFDFHCFTDVDIGQSMAKAVNDIYHGDKSENPEDQDITLSSSPPPSPIIDDDTIDCLLVENIGNFGLVYTKATLTDWIVIFGNTPHYDVSVELHEEDHICVKIQGSKPSLASLMAAKDITKVNPDEWGFPEKDQISTQFKMFSPAPLSTDISKIRTLAYPEQNPIHQYFIFPFYQVQKEVSPLKMTHLQIN